MVGALMLADELAAQTTDPARRPIVLISFETGGVRLHEANAGLLAHAECMDMLQTLRGRVPVVAMIGSKIGCFGGMGFVAAATDIIVMSESGRLGLTGPEVIEQEMGRSEFDASDRALVFRTTGGKHKYIVGDCNYLIADSLTAFHQQAALIADLPRRRLKPCAASAAKRKYAPRWRSRKNQRVRAIRCTGCLGYGRQYRAPVAGGYGSRDVPEQR